jgi:aldose 1-epimerase
MKGGEVFGTTGEGAPVLRFSISGGGLTASIMTLGAAVQDLRLSGHDAPLVLGFERLEDYPVGSYFGAIAGRYANRIRDGRFIIDGKRCQTSRNFLGKHTLHGGAQGFASRLWDVALHGADFVTLTLHDPSGSMGFPGALDVTCTYRLKIPGTLAIELTATCDEPTLCNLAHHSYFNLEDGGSGDILDHRLMLGAAAYLPVDDEMIPTGVVRPVDATAFDFRLARPIRMVSEGEQLGYDHNFCVAASRGALHQAAWAQAPSSGVEMEVWTGEPGLQFYAGAKVAPPVTGLGGRRYKAFAGFCLEPQIWPDSPNRPYFPQALLWPGEIYRQVTEYRFRGA